MDSHSLYTFEPLIRWPTRSELLDTMPADFKCNFPWCVCIIDCFEVFCERPKNLITRAQTYSNYKHHNTVKFLIGISSKGVISFISKGWGGRVSDKYITEKYGILNNLLPGDHILADCGFNIQESVGIFCAEVKVPPFTRRKNSCLKWRWILLVNYQESVYILHRRRNGWAGGAGAPQNCKTTCRLIIIY